MSLSYMCSCPQCGQRMRVGEHQLGHQITCPSCKEAVYIDASLVDTVLPACDIPAEGAEGADASAPRDWNPGDVIVGLYEVNEIIGEGGMGNVFRVHHRLWDIDLAVKSPKADFLADRRCIQTFTRESETWVNLDLHPHVVTCFYTRVLGGIPRIFVELVSGGSLKKQVEAGALYQNGPRNTLKRILEIAVQIAWGLHHAHEQGLIHRDVKPPNVLLTETGTAKVTDFGLATAFAQADLLASGKGGPTAGKGGMTPKYCSPEQALFQGVTRTTDIYSWAVTVMEMLCGEVVWRKGPEALDTGLAYVEQGYAPLKRNHIPDRLVQILRSCCREDPGARPQQMLDVAEAVQRVYEQIMGQPFPYLQPRAIEHRAESINNRAVSLMDLGNTQEAERQWQTAIQVAPRHLESVYNLDLIRWRTGRLTDVDLLATMKELGSFYANSPLLQEFTTHIHLERGDLDAALTALNSASSVSGTSPVPSPPFHGAERLLSYAGKYRDKGRVLVGTLKGHRDTVPSLRLTRCGRYAVSGSHDNTLMLWELSSGRCLGIFKGHGDSIVSVDVDRASEYAVSASKDRTVRVWRLATRECVKELRPHDGVTRTVSFQRNNKYLATGGAEGVVKVWDWGNGQCMHQFPGHTGPVAGLAWTRDSVHILSAGEDGRVGVWEARTEENWGKHSEHSDYFLEGHEDAVLSVSVDRRGRYVISSSGDRTVRVWDLESRRCLRTFRGHTDRVKAAAMSADGRYVVSAGADETVRVWEVASRRCVHTWHGHEGAVNTVDIARDMERAVTGGDDGTVRVWRMGAELPSYTAPLALCRALESEAAASTDSIFRAALHEGRQALDGNDPVRAMTILKEARKQPGYVRNAEVMREWARLYTTLPRTRLTGCWESGRAVGHEGVVHDVACDPWGRIAVSAGADRTVRVWELADGRLKHVFEGHVDQVRRVCLDRKGRHVLSAGADYTLRLWDLAEKKPLYVFEDQVGHVGALSMSPDGEFAVSGAWEVRLWHLGTGRLLLTYPGEPAEVLALEWSPDGRFVFAGCSDNTVRIHHAASGRVLRILRGHTDAVRFLGLSGDGLRLLSASNSSWRQEAEVIEWDVPAAWWLGFDDALREASRMLGISRRAPSARCRGALSGSTAPLTDMALTFDARWAVTSEKDGVVRFWDLSSRECVRDLKASDVPISVLRVAQNAGHVVAGTNDGTLIILSVDWDLQPESDYWNARDASPVLRAFLTRQRGEPRSTAGATRETDAQILGRLERKGKASWEPEDLRLLQWDLACAGTGQRTEDQLRRTLGFLAGTTSAVAGPYRLRLRKPRP